VAARRSTDKNSAGELCAASEPARDRDYQSVKILHAEQLDNPAIAAGVDNDFVVYVSFVRKSRRNYLPCTGVHEPPLERGGGGKRR